MSTHKALLVDDSKSARFFLRNLLQKNGVEVDMVDSGEAALEYLKEHRPHLIFMDHLMPGIDGFETTRAIKQNPETSEVPVVMCTSNEGQEYVERAKSIGAVDILPKPPTENKLHRILDQLMGEAPSAEPAVATPTVSGADIEGIARNAAEAAVRASLDSLVQQLLASRLTELREELQQHTAVHVHQIVSEILAQESGQILDEALTASRQQTKEIADSVVREVASGIIESGQAEARRSATQATTEGLEVWQKQWLSERETLLSQAEERASTSVKAAVAALRSANDDAIQSAAQAAEKSAGRAAERASRDLEASAAKVLGQAKRYAGAAALAGILAAVVVFFLR
jgi:CheY-like chemotaxis protein